jgi:glutamyl-tRNA synthetase
MKNIIKKHALLNAVEYNGKAQAKAVLRKVLAEKPELKKDMSIVGKTTATIVKEVNSWSLDKQRKELKKFGKIEKPEKKERKGLPELPEAKKGKVITRFAPEPNGYLHLGHLKAAVLSFLYAKKYKGRVILRFEDTNPEREKKEFYEAIREDLKAFGLKFDKEVKESDYMEEFYKYAEELIKKGNFYVCTCPQPKIKEMRAKKSACECRDRKEKENLKLWKKMLKNAKQGTMVVRLKTDPKHVNPALREPSMLRIVETAHPLKGKKYRVYPLYNFACIIMDHLLKVTHVLRDKGFENDAKIQEILYNILGWKKPVTIQFGRLKTVAGIPMKKRKIMEMIKEGKLKSFDDIRIPNPRNLLKRGFKPQAIKRLIEEIGPSKADINISIETLETYNRQIIDSESQRFFLVGSPIGILLDKLIVRSVKAPIFPRKRKYRKISTSKKTFIEKQDFVAYRNKEVRLMHFCNILLNKKSKVTSKRVKDIPKIHWVGKRNVKIRVVMPNGKEIEGLAEPEIKKVKPDQTVQFERIGFARCDKPGLFYFAHK